jgi:1-acyl-sn-glycerol-3-phosphate acyltransferase
MGLVTGGLWLVWLAGHVLLLPFRERREAWRRRLFRIWTRAALRALGVELTVVGEVPTEPGFLVSNHLGYLDIPVLAACLPAVFVSKAEVRNWPVLGRMSRSMRTIYVRREKKRELPAVNREIGAALGRGDSIVVFPEGTSTNGSYLAAFRTSLLAPPAAAGLPVRYACLHYETEPGDLPPSVAVAWWGDMAFTPHVHDLLGLSRIRARVTFGSDPIREYDRKLLAEKLWQAVERLFIPIE